MGCSNRVEFMPIYEKQPQKGIGAAFGLAN